MKIIALSILIISYLSSYSQTFSEDSNWEETIEFIKQNSSYINTDKEYASNVVFEITENSITFSYEILKKYKFTETLPLEKLHEVIIASAYLNLYTTDKDVMLIENGYRRPSKSSIELLVLNGMIRVNLYKAFKHLSNLAPEKRKEKKYYQEKSFTGTSEGYKIDGIKIGEWKYYYLNGALKMKGNYKNGQKIDDWVGYYPNGKKFLEGKYELIYTFDGDWGDLANYRSVGTWTSYWENGNVANEYECKGPAKLSTININIKNTKYDEHYTYPSGGFGKGEKVLAISYSIHCEKQEFIDIEKSVDNTGSFSRYGKWTHYNKDGQKSSEGSFNWKTNKHDGEWKYYYENGETRLVKEYKDGEHFRFWEQYLPDGNQILKDGNGVFKVFENNKMTFQSEYKNGGRDGVTTWYYDTGQIEESVLYKFDSSEPYGLRMEIISSFDIKGKERRKGTLKNGNGTWISYDENGKVSHITEYKNGIKVVSK
ncbi:hypothetical protein BTO05_00775 [Winogradskyella sp. PC-19]|uniref:toxin-antitoxin system YwqK family antitoxin n=1 Tax=Winogradskyella sp. PC-19 TaxID=754417 RepID=UPI000B3BE9CD|nr:hypothetical protein [Winogradskyella sp. PC-19]ARV08240.1 hypothetical protein BTO05_00775 [Winogradskyella sp. PC-19]